MIEDFQQYFKDLEKRSKKSRVHHPYQAAGLALAVILGDLKYKSLYIKLAKRYGGEVLLPLAKSVAEKKEVKNKAAYFMKILKLNGYFNSRK